MEEWGEDGMGLGWTYRLGWREGTRGSYQTGWLDQALSCRWGHMPGSVMKTGKFKSLGFKLLGFRGWRGPCNWKGT